MIVNEFLMVYQESVTSWWESVPAGVLGKHNIGVGQSLHRERLTCLFKMISETRRVTLQKLGSCL